MTEKHKEPEKHAARAVKPAPTKGYEAGLEQEHKDLSGRIEKLNEFLVVGEFNSLHPDDQALVHKQQDVMSQYLDILQRRIQHHNEEG